MQQFILIAYDAKDDDAPRRRMDCRNEHLAVIAKLRESGNMLIGAAITGEKDNMIGSVIIASFPTRKEFDAWLAIEPYMVNKVWGDVTVLNGKLAPTFNDLLKKVS